MRYLPQALLLPDCFGRGLQFTGLFRAQGVTHLKQQPFQRFPGAAAGFGLQLAALIEFKENVVHFVVLQIYRDLLHYITIYLDVKKEFLICMIRTK